MAHWILQFIRAWVCHSTNMEFFRSGTSFTNNYSYIAAVQYYRTRMQWWIETFRQESRGEILRLRAVIPSNRMRQNCSHKSCGSHFYRLLKYFFEQLWIYCEKNCKTELDEFYSLIIFILIIKLNVGFEWKKDTIVMNISSTW